MGVEGLERYLEPGWTAPIRSKCGPCPEELWLEERGAESGLQMLNYLILWGRWGDRLGSRESTPAVGKHFILSLPPSHLHHSCRSFPKLSPLFRFYSSFSPSRWQGGPAPLLQALEECPAQTAHCGSPWCLKDTEQLQPSYSCEPLWVYMGGSTRAEVSPCPTLTIPVTHWALKSPTGRKHVGRSPECSLGCNQGPSLSQRFCKSHFT